MTKPVHDHAVIEDQRSLRERPIQEQIKPKHSHFTPEALKQRVCPVCGVVMPTSSPTGLSN